MSNESHENTHDSRTIINATLAKISGKVLTIIAGLLISIGTMAYSNINTRITTLEDRVSFLYQDKLSRSEFSERMNQIQKQNEALKADIIARQDNMKDDILSRLDLILKAQKGQFSNVP